MTQTQPETPAPAASLPPQQVARIPDDAGSVVAGLHIGYREAGPPGAPALLCMHGIGSNATGFRFQLSGLSDRFRVISWDAPGYGPSGDLAADNPATSEYADAAIALLDELKIEKCHIAGSSLGALIAASAAARHGGRIRTVTLIAPATGNARLDAADREAQLRSRIDDLQAYGAEQLAKLRAPKLVSEGASDEAKEIARELVATIHARGYGQAAHMLANGNIFGDLPTIQAPTMIVVGSEDTITPAATFAEEIHAAMPDAEYHCLKGIGHLLKLEAPDQLNMLLRDFLGRHG